MSATLIIRLIVSALVFFVGWQVDNRTAAFIFFSIASCILIYPLFLNKK